ncbi:GNAT family N-acetyltransferase [Nocardioides speluncae]|uniref:GNAT family N-acetyltransferase n=1 Tax=Nocardioides speluncae TaxID=2670337 RepID=UPI000D68BC9D|nr:GNAT family N-acetyltransferase [Nocardioides speluncae]
MLTQLETYYDTVPRAAATLEEVGPFTLFIADQDRTNWQFYARPRLGETAAVTAADVRRVLDRQRELGVPRAIEWVDETTPGLLPAVREALGVDAPVAECPLLVLPPTTLVESPESGRYDVLDADHADLPLQIGAVHAAFGSTDDVSLGDLGGFPALIRDGKVVLVAAYDADGTVIGGGTGSPRGETSELMGIAVLPRARKSGHGTAITAALVNAVRDRGVQTVFLSAGSDDAASIYRAVGFERVGTACILEVPGG